MIKNISLSIKNANTRMICRIMKLMSFFLTLGIIVCSASNSYSQSTILSLNLKQKTIEDVFRAIEKKSEYIFLYNDETLDVNRKITVNIENQTIDKILDEMFRGTDNIYQISDRQVYISKKASTSAKKIDKNPSRRITGTVVDDLNEPLVGVTIRVKARPSTGTATDINGKYLLDVFTDDILEFIYVGFKTQEILVKDRGDVIDVKLMPNTEILEEVEVVGYGTQKRISIIGSQQTIKAEELKVPVANLTNSLAGRVSGIVSVQRSGEPGFDDSNIYIRGISTLSASMSTPLTLVDGVPRSFSNVDPEDIESFTILKDASATAIYGVRGANGVIIINTKSGNKGKPKFSFRYTEGITRPTKITKFADGAKFMEVSNEASMTRGGLRIYSQNDIEMTRTGADPYMYPNVDWMEEILRDFSRNRSANLNIQGGADQSKYYIGVAYYDENGMYKDAKSTDYDNNTYYRRYNVTSNLTLTPTRTTEIKLGVQGYLANANYPGASKTSIFEKAYFSSPVYVAPMYPNGTLGDRIGGSIQNAYALLGYTGYANQWRSQVFSNLRATQKLPFIVEGLSVAAMFSFDSYNYTSNRFTKTPDTFQAYGRDADGNLLYTQTRSGTENLSYSKNSNGNRSIYMEGSINYQNSFDGHSVSGMLLFNQSDELNTQAGNVEEALPYRFRGLAGRFTYSYNDRYFLETNFGYNGSENFAPDKRYGFFPSFGVGWVLSNESFFEPLTSYVQYAKLRGTWGKVGNSKITGRRFAYLATVNNNNSTVYEFGKDMNQSFGRTELGEYAVDVTWETAKKTNLGLDLMILDNKLNIQMDVFKEQREGIFLRRSSIPSYVGMLNNPYGNIGKVDNKGFEIALTYNNSWGDWSLSLMGNYSFNRNKIIEDDRPWSYPWQYTTGNKVGQRFGLIALGLFESDEEIKGSPIQSGDTRVGDIKYKDLNGDGKIDEYDKGPIGWGSVPEILYGFGFGLGYKNVSLSAMFQGAAHVDAMLSGEGLLPFTQGLSVGNLLSNIDDRWTEDNPRQDVFYPRLMPGSLNMNYETSTWWLKNTSYLRLKNVELSYMLPKEWTKKAYISNAKIFLQGVNLLTISSFDLWDVELGDGRGATYPNVASLSVGVSFNF